MTRSTTPRVIRYIRQARPAPSPYARLVRSYRELAELPRIPTTMVLGAVAIFAMFVVMPSVDRFGFLIGVLTVGVLLVIAEVAIPEDRH